MNSRFFIGVKGEGEEVVSGCYKENTATSSFQEELMHILENVILAIQVVILLLSIWLIKGYFPSYFAEKGKNLATKEDIGRITAETERIRLQYELDLEKAKNEFQRGIELMKHQLSIALDSSKELRNLETQAYVDFIRGIAGLAIAQKHNNSASAVEYLVLTTDAKARIAIYGGRDVVESAAAFFEEHEALSSIEECKRSQILFRGCEREASCRKSGYLAIESVRFFSASIEK
jgi:hypothetical protein